MTPITPNGKVYVLSGTPLTDNSPDTYWFETQEAQFNFFYPKAVWTADNCAPVRIGESFRFPANANRIYPCSYMMFQNTNYNQKWFYAFIEDVRWISVNDCEIVYKIDDFQTWLFEARFPPCFVEREHAIHDAPGDNLIPENLELGEYEMLETLQTGFFNEYVYMAACSFDKNGGNAVGGLYSGIYNGLSLNTFESPTELNTFLSNMTSQNKASGVVSIIMFPKQFLADKGSTSAAFKTFQVTKLQTGQLNGYVPRNNKLYTYPFNLLLCSNLGGTAAEFRYEDFSAENCDFWVYTDMSCNPTAICIPYMYNGSTGPNWNEKITMDGFPQCSWTTDTFRAWLAQNGSSTSIGLMSSALGGLGSLVQGNFGGALSSAANIAQTVAKVSATATLPPQAHGATAGSALVACRQKDFYFFRLCVKPEFLRIADDYFDMFGYAVHEVKTPRFTGRESWNYVKCQEAKVLGALPSPSARAIESMLNSGIRVWHGDFLGQYFRSNNIVEG